MDIKIKNCNNIDSGEIKVDKNVLNIKYAINGTGKTTISKAIIKSAIDRTQGSSELYSLKPYKAEADKNIIPEISGCENLNSIKAFDERYINEFVFQQDELVKGSFDIFIRDSHYINTTNEIERLLLEIKHHFTNDKEVEELLSDFSQLSATFGKETKTGIHGSSAIAKAFKNGNKIDNVPEGLEIYKPFIQGRDNAKWIKWQIDGTQFKAKDDSCPYCVSNVEKIKDTIRKVSEIYDPKAIENLNNIISIFKRLESYFSDNTKNSINSFVSSINGYTNEQIDYLKEVKDQIDRLSDQFANLKNIGFITFKKTDEVAEALRSYRINPELYVHLKSDKTKLKIDLINKSIDDVLAKVGILQGKVSIQKRHVENLVQENKSSINSFLKNAGFSYEVDLLENQNGEHQLKLIHKDLANAVKETKERLSYGERNAFALILFMHDAIKNKPDLVILDDPISSFDKNKKYAIIEALFKSRKSLRGHTVLMLTHDFEPVVDMLIHHSDRFEKPSVAFLENKKGTLREVPILKEDISTFLDINYKNIELCDNIISKLVYMRRNLEIMNDKCMGYQLISNVLHKRCPPKLFANGALRAMTEEEIEIGIRQVKERIPEFEFATVIDLVSNDIKMKQLYQACTNNYEKLHIYRIIFDDKVDAIEQDVIQKFIKQAFHIENDYIYQINPTKYQTVPQYVIDACDRYISTGI
jgi:ABC-type nitrate/sulfonate/bicarbonate transport system ATPase subunit